MTSTSGCPPPGHRAGHHDPAAQLLTSGGAVVGWTGWRAIDRAEQEYGARLGRERVKLHDRTRLLAAAMIATKNGS